MSILEGYRKGPLPFLLGSPVRHYTGLYRYFGPRAATAIKA